VEAVEADLASLDGVDRLYNSAKRLDRPRRRRFVPDSSLERTGFEPLVPADAKEFAGYCQREILDRPAGSRIKLSSCRETAMLRAFCPRPFGSRRDRWCGATIRVRSLPIQIAALHDGSNPLSSSSESGELRAAKAGLETSRRTKRSICTSSRKQGRSPGRDAAEPHTSPLRPKLSGGQTPRRRCP